MHKCLSVGGFKIKNGLRLRCNVKEMGWRTCLVPCCGVDKETVGQEVPVDQAMEVDETFVFLEQFPTDKIVQNPVVPFIGELPVPIDVGRVIDVEGQVLPNAIRFSVNLAYGTSPDADVAFHLNPRFDQNHVVRNSRLSGRWGQEECATSQRNPFKRGTTFFLTIFAAEDEFLVAVNGKHYCSYPYRTMRMRIQSVQIQGDVEVKTLDYRMTDTYPEKRPHMPDLSVIIAPGQPLSDTIPDKVELPLLCSVPPGFTVGRQIEIVGRVKLLPHSFYVNLQTSLLTWPHPDFLLHFNPRFKYGGGRWAVLNSWIKDKWGTEEKVPNLFTPGRPFLLKIECKEEEYSITVDGTKLGTYHHRSPPATANTFVIQGDVVIKEVTVS